MYTLEILYFLNINGKFSISSSPVIYMFGLWVEILTQAQGKRTNSTLMCLRFESWNMLLWSNTFIPCTSKTHPNQTYSIIWFSARGHLTAEVLAGCLCVNAIPQSSQDVPTHLPRDQTMLAERDWTSTVCCEGLLEKVSSLLKEHDSLTLKTASEQIKWLHYPQLALTHSMWP